MTRRISIVALLSVGLLLAAVPLARAAEDVLKLVPERALGFVVLNRVGATDAKLQELGRQAQLPIPSVLAMLKQESGIRSGLDEKGTITALLLPPQEGDAKPSLILLLPVTDYGKFLAQFEPKNATDEVVKIKLFGANSWVRNLGGYAAVTEWSNREMLEKDVKVAKQVPADLAPLRKWLAEKDAAVVFLSPGIKLLSAKAQQGIQAMKAAMAAAGPQGEQATAGLEMYAKLFRAVEKEVSISAVGVQRDKTGAIRLNKRVRLVAGGSWAQLVAKVSPAKENLLAGLPAGPFVFAAGGEIPEPAWTALMQFSIDIIQSTPKLYGLTEEQVKKMPGLMGMSIDGMKAVRSMSLVQGVGRADEPLYANMLSTIRVDNARAFLGDYEKMMKQYSEFVREFNSPMLLPAQLEKTEIAGQPALQITMKFPQAVLQAQPHSERMMEHMFGPGGKIVAWLAVADEHTLIMGYTSKAPLERAIQAIKQGEQGLAGDADLRKTAALLPSGAPWVAFWSPKGTIEFVNRMVPAFAPPGVKTEFKLPDFAATPPIGCAVAVAPGELRSCLAIPPEVVTAIGQYVGKLKPALQKPGKAASPISGKVTLDGKPLADGATIKFVASGSGASATLPLKDGKYAGALKAGKYTVSVSGAGVPRRFHLPNTSGLTVEFEKTPCTFDFNLSSK